MSSRPQPKSRIRRYWPFLFGAVLATSTAAHAIESAFPLNAERTAQQIQALGSYELPVGPWQDGRMTTWTGEGRVETTAWRFPAAGMTTLQILEPLRARLIADGWNIVFDCETRGCGGFDFRYATLVLPEPEMHVDLGDFRFLSARRGDSEALSMLASRATGSGTGHVQIVRVAPAENRPDVALATKSEPERAVAAGSHSAFAAALEAGSVVLEGLTFESGAASLAEGGDAVLAELAAYLAAHPDRSIALVGHTDADGGFEANLALSRRRAEAVRTRMIQHHEVDPGRLTALGAGFMAPRASNLTEAGRLANRRVEAILTSTR